MRLLVLMERKAEGLGLGVQVVEAVGVKSGVVEAVGVGVGVGGVWMVRLGAVVMTVAVRENGEGGVG